MKTASDIFPEIRELRHFLHQHPELSGREYNTSAELRSRLEKAGIPVLPPFIGTDVVAVIQGGRGAGRNVTLRADMDALAIEEKTGLPYASVNSGVMHACGHDAHSAMLLGAAGLLWERRDEFAGSIRFVWQPGEENIQLGRELVAAGVLENPRADLVAALHGMPGLPTGVLGVRSGASEASCIHFSITVSGKGGHSSRPDRAADPVVCASALVLELQTIVSRRISPLESAVLSICTIHGGTLGNVIPNEVTMTGTARSFSPENDAVLMQGIREITDSICTAHRCTGDVQFDSCYPVTFNTPEAAELARQVIAEKLGSEFLFEREAPSMGADDFAYYTQNHEGIYLKIGIGDVTALHTDTFDFTDEAMLNGMTFLTEFALAGLRS